MEELNKLVRNQIKIAETVYGMANMAF